MKYPLDILYLDETKKVVKTVSELKPNRFSSGPPRSKSVLELPAGFIKKFFIEEDDQLQLKPDIRNKFSQRGLSSLFHWPVNISLGLLWCRLIIHSAESWFSHGGPLNLGIVFHNTLLLILFISRRRSKDTSSRPTDWLIPILTMACVMLLSPAPSSHFWASTLSIWIQCIGMAFMLWSLASLGRSFGIIPANRSIKNAGTYQWMRHPLYAGEIVFYVGFLIGNFTFFNLFMVLLIISGQIYRTFAEERLLLRDNLYRSYVQQVRFRIIPGIF